jgi:pyruvate formate lyase activating enzyme
VITWTERQHQFDPDDRHRETVTGLIFDIQRFSVHDGPGIRTTVFLKGCPLRCLWCQNPESISRYPEITYIASKCIRCDKCYEICPEDALRRVDGTKEILRDACTLCGDCLDVCYAEALNIVGRWLTVPELMNIVERDREFYVHSEGGVTFSGGEPTAQPEFLRAACQEAQSRRLHTTIDTCGYVGWETFRSILEHVDLVLYDIKHMNSEIHRKLTGVPNTLILQNLRRLAQINKQVHVRLPLIPGHNDSEENVRATAAFIAELPNVRSLDILPYHRLGEPKWSQLAMPYELHELEPPGRDHVQHLADMARQYDVEISVGG